MLSRRLRRCVPIVVAFSAAALAQMPAPPADEGDPVVKSWEPPQPPSGVAENQLPELVVVEFVVDAAGQVTAARADANVDPLVAEAAVASVRQWTFEPAISGGQPVACAMRVPVMFRPRSAGTKAFTPPREPEVLPRTSPSVKRWGRIDAPPICDRRKLGGTVVVEFSVSPEGLPERPRVLTADNADLVWPALEGLMRTEFEPARQGELLAVPAMLRAPFEFDARTDDRLEQLSVNGITRAAGESWDGFQLLPVPVVYCDPVYPFDALLAATAGEAEVEFTVTASGAVRDVTLTSATQPEFGLSLATAIRQWGFRPAQTKEGKVEVRLAMRQRFEPPADGVAEGTARLLQRLRPGGEGIAGAKGIDGRLTPLYRVGPAPSDEWSAAPAEAQVEFIIDGSGRARLPRVTRSTSEVFGWAAATAVSQWVFARPTRGGEPTDVRVSIPITHRP